MSWHYVCDRDGCLQILVSRFYNRTGNKEEILTASGFEPYEPVDVDICSENEDKGIIPFQENK